MRSIDRISLVTGVVSSSGTSFWVQWCVSLSLLLALLWLLVQLKIGQFGDQYRMLAVITVFASIPLYMLVRVYQKNLGYLSGLMRVLVAWLLLLGLLTVIGFITKTSDSYSREVLLQWMVLGGLLQAISFLALHSLNNRYHQRLLKQCNTLIVGTSDSALKLADTITRKRGEPLSGLVTVANDVKQHIPPNIPPIYPVLGDVTQLRALIREHHITRLYIVLPLQLASQIEGLYIDMLDLHVDVIWLPDLADMTLLNHSISSIDGMPAINLNESPLSAYPVAILVKAVLDRVLAVFALLVFSPVMLSVALVIKLSSPGPVIFKQRRHGYDDEIIEVWKFRSMRVHDDADVVQATRADTRITPIGRFIRRTSIDELPQFFNVLQGRMSLVGPRPHAVAHNDYYANKINAYMARHRIKPGITGLAQVSGCRGETETLDKMQQRINYDLDYINNWSLFLDVKILMKTPVSLISKDVY
jgi:putative colanic acid biosynthesis UDP-glucose lipid carrier transferase